MLSSIANVAARFAPDASKASAQADGASVSSFADILVSTTGGGDVRSNDLATGAAARAALSDVGMLAQWTGALRDVGPGNTFGIATIGSDGRVIAGTSIGPNGDLSVFGSGESDGTTSSVDLSLDSQGGGSWFGDVSAELAQASYQLNALANQSLAASKSAGVDATA